MSITNSVNNFLSVSLRGNQSINRVEIDESRLDILLLDDGPGMALHRPTMITIRDHDTSLIVGLAVEGSGNIIIRSAHP